MTHLAHIADRLLNTPLLITPEKAQVIAAVLADRVGLAEGLSRFEGSPVVIVRGFLWQPKENASVQTLLRKPHEDMFR